MGRFGRFSAGSLTGLFCVALLVYCGVRLQWNLSTTGFLCLLVVVFTATLFGFWEATVVSLLAVTCLNYFFVPPVLTFSIADPENWIALASFEITALVVSRLSTKVRDRANAEARQRRNTELLYELSRRILVLDRRETVGALMVCLIREIVEANAVALFDATSAHMDSTDSSTEELEKMARNAYLTQADVTDEARGVSQRALRLGTGLLGGLALQATGLDKLTMDAIASLTAIALERARSFETESRSEAARQSEQLRTAVLDSLAHALKTPLTAIRTASSGLLVLGGLNKHGAELAKLIDEESEHLNQLTSDLLKMARIDAAEVKVRRERIPVRLLLEEILTAQPGGHRFEILTPAGEPVAYADPALLKTALLQLIDNAAKYSTPGSGITIRASESDAELIVSVHNDGPSIRAADREHIFERFYRAPDSKHRAAGTGLGLSIAKKTAEAHHGRVWVVSEDQQGTTFYFALPQPVRRDHDHAAR